MVFIAIICIIMGTGSAQDDGKFYTWHFLIQQRNISALLSKDSSESMEKMWKENEDLLNNYEDYDTQMKGVTGRNNWIFFNTFWVINHFP